MKVGWSRESRTEYVTNEIQMTLEDLAFPNASVEYNIAKLSVLTNRFLSSLCVGQMSSKTREVFFHALEEWAANLPQNLRCFPDIYDPQSSQADEVASVRKHSGREES